MTRDELLAKAKGMGKSDAEAAAMVDAYLAKKGAPASAPKPKATRKAKAPPKVDKPETPKPSPVVTAQTPASPTGPTGGARVAGPVEEHTAKAREMLARGEAEKRAQAQLAAYNEVMRSPIDPGAPFRSGAPAAMSYFEEDDTAPPPAPAKPSTTAADYFDMPLPAPKPPANAPPASLSTAAGSTRGALETKADTAEVGHMREKLKAAARQESAAVFDRASDEQIRAQYAKRFGA